MQYNYIYIMSYKFYINIYRKVLTHAIYHDIVISTNKKAGDHLPSEHRHQSKKKGSYIIAQVKRNEKNKQQGS